MSNKHRSGWSYIGEGLAWLLILTGLGSCCYLANRDARHPLIVIERAK